MNPLGTPGDSGIMRPQSVAIEAGMIGWDDESEVALMGTEDNDGTTLIKVQLFRGIDPLREPNGRAQGHKILARLSGFPFWAIPPKDMQCFVGFPAGFGTTPGAGVIIALPGANPFVQFSETRAKIDVGRDQDLVIKGRSVTLVMHNPDDPDGQEDFISITPQGGIQMGSRDGLGVVIKDGTINLFVPDDSNDVKTVLRLSKDFVDICQKNASDKSILVQIGNEKFVVQGKAFEALTSSGVLGFSEGATPLPIALGPAGAVVSTGFVGM